MTEPVPAPDAIPPRQLPEPSSTDEAEGSEAVQHEPDPKANPPPSTGRKPPARGPDTAGNG